MLDGRAEATMRSGRRVLVIGLMGMALLWAPAAASASTGAELDPASGSPGDTIDYLNGCVGVVTDFPASATAAFIVPGSGPPTSRTPRTTAHRAGDGYRFRIPQLDPGTYTVLLECKPGDWDTNLAEPGGPVDLTVVPATDTATSSAMPRAPSPADRSMPLVLAVSGAVGVLIAGRGLARRRLRR